VKGKKTLAGKSESEAKMIASFMENSSKLFYRLLVEVRTTESVAMSWTLCIVCRGWQEEGLAL